MSPPTSRQARRYNLRRIIACVGVLLLTWVPGSESAEWGKLKKCSDLSFCRRHRSGEGTMERPGYRVVPSSVRLGDWRGSSAMMGSLLRGSETDPFVQFAVTALRDGMYRLVLEDAVTPLHVRHVVKDVLTSEAAPLVIASDALSVDTARAVLTAAGVSGPKVSVSFDPFKVEVFAADSGLDATPVVAFNAESLLRFETHVVKPVPPPSPSPSPSPSPTDSGAAHEDETLDEDIDSEIDMPSEKDSSLETSADQTAGEEEEEGLWEEQFQSHRDPKVRGPESVGADVSFPFADHLYGIPERTERFALPHTIHTNGSAASEPYRLYNLDVFEFELHKPLGLYGAVPFMIGRRGASAAGVLWLNSAETYVDLLEKPGETPGRVSHWFSETGHIDVFFMPGPSVANVYHQYLKLTGAPAMPQRFALGYHQCRWNYRDDADARAVDAEFDKQEIPYDVLWLDIEHTDGKRYFTWDSGKFPDPTKLQMDVAERGRKMVTIIDPHVKRDKKYEVHAAAEDNGYYVKTPEGASYEGWCWPGSSSYYDFTSPVARSAWAARFNPTDYPHFTEHLYTWIDMNEPSVFNGPEGTMPKHMLHVDNVEHRDVHNQYGFYNQQTTFEGLLRGHGGNDRPFVLSRSFFAGSQRFGTVWTGDNTAAWDHLETSARMILPLQLSGIVFSGADVGGFFGNPSPELLVRWYQAAAFQPFFRGHAHLDTNRREPWLFGEENTRLIREAIRTRYSYVPFWYTLMAANALSGTHAFASSSTGPPMRPVWWEYPDDARTDTMEDQWLVGSSLLAAPVVTEGAGQRTVYLPGTEPWYDVLGPEGIGERVAGTSAGGSGIEAVVETPLSRMVAFQRGGSIIPRQERVRRSTRAMATDPYTLVVALDSNGDAEGELYMDDGRSYDYTRGSHVLRRFRFSNGRLTAATIFGDAQTGAFVGADCVVERIVVMGVEASRAVTGAEVTDSDGRRQLHVRHDASAGVAVIRKPDVFAGRGEWAIKFEAA